MEQMWKLVNTLYCMYLQVNTDQISGKKWMWESDASFWNTVLLYIKPTVPSISCVFVESGGSYLHGN